MTMDSISRRNMIKGTAVAAGASTVGASAAMAAASVPEPDLALVNGKILTMDGGNSVASALLIRSGRIVEIGTTVGKAARTIDLKGATVIPGLIDAHAHIYWAFNNPGHEARDIELARSVAEVQQALTARARSVPAGELISCNGGWHRQQLAELRLPNRAELDVAAPNHPVWIAESQGEDAWINPDKVPPTPAVVNSAGLAFFAKLGVQGDANTGQIPWSPSSIALMKVQTPAQRKRSVDDVIDTMVGYGLTMLHDFGNGVAPDGSLDAQFPYIMDMWRKRDLKLRFRLRSRAPEGTGIDGLRARMINASNRLGDEVVRLNGFGEGIGGRTPESFAEAAKAVAQYGWSAHVHSLSATEIAGHIAGFRAADAVYPIAGYRWSLGHVNGITPALVKELMAMGVGVTGDAWPYTAGTPDKPLGPPWRMLVDSGIPFGAGSDCTGAAGANPWLTIDYMTTGRNGAGKLANDPAQSITRHEAIKLHTIGSAWHSFDEDDLGSLEVGKLADLAVLDADPLTVSDDNLRRITASLTLQAGKTVHEKG